SQQQRIKLTASQVEKAFAGDSSVDTWGELVPGIAGTPTNAALSGAGITTCAAVPIRRIVRRDDSGTTFVVKDWFQKVNPALLPAEWVTFTTAPNTSWPNPVGVGADGTCAVTANLCKSSSDGGGALADLLNTVDGGIGYADLATSRSKGFESVGTTSPAQFDT